MAAYRAKAGGRGRVEVFDDALRRDLQERAGLEQAMRSALVDGEFVLHFQPVIELDSGRVTCFEALIRWDRPGHGLLTPEHFLPTAEQSSLGGEIGRWVLQRACEQTAAWNSDHPDAPVRVAVNVSGRHLASAGIVDDVLGALAGAGLAPEALVLEISEVVFGDHPLATAHLHALRAAGVSVSIDNFGTGYTSLGALQHLPVDTLKIDRSVLSGSRAGGADLFALMVTAAHAFGLTVVAEGVEHEAHLDAARGSFCDSVQGNLFARPASAALVREVAAATRVGSAES